MTCAPVNSILPKSCRRGRPIDPALRDRRCEQILCKASHVFAELGYRDADVQIIANNLGISKGTVYRYFTTKERLFLAAVQRGVERLDEHIQSAVGEAPDPLERIAVATRAYLEFFEKHPHLVELFIQERAEFRGRKNPVYFQQRDARRAPWRKLFAGLIAQGRLREIPVDRIINVLGDLLYGTMFTNHLSGRRKSFEAQGRDILDVVFHGLLTEQERRRMAWNNRESR